MAKKQMSNDEKMYINGFYSALTGVRFISNVSEITVENIIDAIDETLTEMRDAGELDHVDGSADELLKIIGAAQSVGLEDELFARLDQLLGGK